MNDEKATNTLLSLRVQQPNQNTDEHHYTLTAVL